MNLYQFRFQQTAKSFSDILPIYQIKGNLLSEVLKKNWNLNDLIKRNDNISGNGLVLTTLESILSLLYETSVYFLDLYKSLTWKQQFSLTSNFEQLSHLKQIKSLEEIIELFLKDTQLLHNAFLATQQFYQINIVGKKEQFMLLNSNDHEFLTNLIPLYREDQIEYNCPIHLDDYIWMIKEMFYEDEKDDIFLIIHRNLSFLKEYNIHNYYQVVRELVLNDYRWLSLNPNVSLQMSVEMKKRKVFLEQSDIHIEQIAYKLLNNIEYFLQIVNTLRISITEEQSELKSQAVKLKILDLEQKLQEKEDH